jgi:hypothetical protein
MEQAGHLIEQLLDGAGKADIARRLGDRDVERLVGVQKAGRALGISRLAATAARFVEGPQAAAR